MSSTGGGSWPGRPRAQVDEGLLQRGEQTPRLRVGVGGEDVEPEHDVGLVELLATGGSARDRASSACISLLGREMRGEGEGQARARRRAARRRGSSPGSRPARRARARHGAHRAGRAAAREIGHQLQHVLREVVDVAGEGAAQRPRGALVGARRAAEAEIDAAGIERLQGAELLGDDQRRVVGQHDAAGADADGRRAGGDMADHHRGRGAGDAGHVVVLGQPVAAVAQALGMPGEVEGVAQGLAGVAALDDRREVEDGEGDHPGNIAARAPAGARQSKIARRLRRRGVRTGRGRRRRRRGRMPAPRRSSR